MMDDRAERIAGLRLSRSRGLGPITFHQLLRKFGSPSAALEALPGFLEGKGKTSRITLAPEGVAERELDALEKVGGQLLGAWEATYPPALKAIADSPPLISVLGRAELLDPPGVALVGARNASAAGRRIAAQLAVDLGAAGLTITSGLARGIDGAAHEAALGTGTIAVLAGGVDRIYPPQHDRLYAAIRDQGAIVSEMPLGYEATARDFPKRNRIVSGLTKGVVVIEAADRSGTLITARLALEQGRDVFAVPGSPLDPRAAGTNRLIRQGATLIRHAEDVLEALSSDSTIPFPVDGSFMEDPLTDYDENNDLWALARADVLALLSPVPVHRDVLLRTSSVSAAQLADILLDLVISGEVEEVGGGMFALSSSASLSST